MVQELTSKEFNEFIKKGVVLIDFHAHWCMPCVIMSPIIDEISKKFRGKLKVGKINLDENNELAQKYNIRSIPNFIIFKNGKVVDQFIGSISKEEFEKKLRKYF